MPRNSSHPSKEEKFLKRAVQLITEKPETYFGKGQESEILAPNWVAVVFVNLHIPTVSEATLPKALETYHTRVKQILAGNGGDMVAASREALVALFSAPATSTQYAQPAIDAAVELMDELATMNRRRLAQDLTPLRAGVGVDCGKLPTAEANRHPRLAASLERYIKRARRLSELNRQAPVPAVFISRETLDGLAGHGGHDVQALGEAVTPDEKTPLAVHALLYDDARRQMM